MKKLGIKINITKDDSTAFLMLLVTEAKKLDIELFSDDSLVKSIIPDISFLDGDAFFNEIDALLALGGDGTMLWSVYAIGGSEVPVLGINIGSLGFLTSVAGKDLVQALEALVNEDYFIQDIALGTIEVRRKGKVISKYQFMNEVVVSRGDSPRVVTLSLGIDHDKGMDYLCDGLIVSMPSGSTGHSLSAGGPIVHPEADVFVITQICPHTLSARPLVIPLSKSVKVKVKKSAKKSLLSVDGQEGVPLLENDSVVVKKSLHGVKIIRLQSYNYYELLRKKLKWSGSNLV
ncbi:MAG: NAD(+)/NADH kinase [Kiritimatiellae bacterium]|jgi:NAD+ kinase|nr:NAD(+)/NADH kinase [Kiritimatiellia bacterium]